MKIGIVTFQWSYNCGSILQCMGLRKVLSGKGHDVDVINFSTPAQSKLYSVFYPWNSFRNTVKNILCIPGKNTIADHYDQYKKYIKTQFGYSKEPWRTSEDLRKFLPQYDALIAGGDQVWNVNCDDFSPAYMLNFSDDTYKFSYSPSLGATDINQSPHASEYRALLNKFDGISCREPNGKLRLEKLLGKDVTLALDPSLLLSKEDWQNEINDDACPYPKDSFFFITPSPIQLITTELLNNWLLSLICLLL